MDWIINDIATGNYLDAHNVSLLNDNGIISVMSLNGFLQETTPKETGVDKATCFSLEDDRGMTLRYFSESYRLLKTSLHLNHQCSFTVMPV